MTISIASKNRMRGVAPLALLLALVAVVVSPPIGKSQGWWGDSNGSRVEFVPLSIETPPADLSITTWISGEVAIKTVVKGKARNVAEVTIVFGAMPGWTVTLTQFTPKATIPTDIIVGEQTVKKGGTFNLIIPTPLQQGSIFANLTLVTPTIPDGQRLAANVSAWTFSGPLSSAPTTN